VLSQLSYSPFFGIARIAGIAKDLLEILAMFGNLGDFGNRYWWAWVELNYRPHPYQGCALAN
jgi:hypothetical protein